MPVIESVSVAAYRLPTQAPESDGTLTWDATTLVLVEASAQGVTGLGYSYSHESAAALIRDPLIPLLAGQDAFAIPRHWQTMQMALRNLGRPGLGAGAISAVDTALWDLKARLLNLPLVQLLGAVREQVPLYGSGGFTSYTPEQLEAQFNDWRCAGITRMKMKVGRQPDKDVPRLRVVREAVGRDTELFVDANGAYDRKQALAMARAFAELGVSWFEEPVSSDDLDGLRLLRERAPPGMEISAGEYGYVPDDFRRLLEHQAVDVLQADITRCLGLSGLLHVAALCEAFHIPLSSHTAPALHLHPCCALRPLRHMEWFHDHVRIESELFEGAPVPQQGMLRPDLSRPGHGLGFRHEAAARWRVEP